MSSSSTPDEAEAPAQAELLDVIAHVVHELRTPLAVIEGYAALLGKAGSAPAPTDFVDAIARNATVIQRRLDLLADTEELLRFGLQLQPEPCELGELVEDVVHGFAQQLERNPVRIEVLAVEEVSVDRRRLAQAIGHLLDDAARFSPAEAAIEIRVDSGPEGATISLRDHGGGVREQLLPPLFRRVAETGDGTGNRGLGLYLTRSIIEAHGGVVRHEPAPGGGAEFVIELPSTAVAAHVRSEPVMHPAIEERSAVPSAIATVVHFEDDESVANLVEWILGPMDIAVINATSAVGGAELVRRHRPDAVLLDFELDGTDGEDVLRRLQSDPSTAAIPVIVVSGGLTDARSAVALAEGASAVLAKPFDPEALLNTLRGVLGAGDRTDRITLPTSPGGEHPLDLRFVHALEELGDDFGDGTRITALVEAMVSDAASSLHSLHLAAAVGDGRQAARLAHSISGSVGNLGAHLVVRACRELEDAANAGDTDDLPGLADRVSVTLRDAEAALAARFGPSAGSGNRHDGHAG